MLESFFKVPPFKIALGLSLLVLAIHYSASAQEEIQNPTEGQSLVPVVDLDSFELNSPREITEPNSGAPLRPAGLELGNNLTHVKLRGHVRMQCEDYLLAVASEYDCSMDTLEPFTSSRFQTPLSVDADHFALRVQHEKSWARSKSGTYEPSSATSTLSLNLWNSSILDLPILDDGVNQATYSLSKNGKAVATGSFTVNVANVARACAPATLVSYDAGDCRKKSYACDRYFFQNRHCLVP